MPRRGRSEEQIIAALRQAESAVAVKEVGRQVGISENTFYTRKRKYVGIGVSEPRELRQLQEENARLKRLVADLSLDKHILQDELAKKV
jgi:putative transposase